jgi:AcrR family transcriptional regulator
MIEKSNPRAATTLFRLFKTKHALFLAAVAYLLEVVERSLREAAEGLTGEVAIAARSVRYRELLADGDLLPLQLQMLATAAHDDECRKLAAEGMASLWRMIADAAGASPDEIERFIFRGIMLSVLTALDIRARPFRSRSRRGRPCTTPWRRHELRPRRGPCRSVRDPANCRSDERQWGTSRTGTDSGVVSTTQREEDCPRAGNASARASAIRWARAAYPGE